MAVQGLDVSACQGANLNFVAIKNAGYDFVILRINEWSNALKDNVKDSCFETFYARAKAAGLKVGAYWFTYANTVGYVAYEAKKCIEWIKGKQFEYPIWFDLEREQQFQQGKAFCDPAVTTFCEALLKAGYYPGVYCSTFWYTNCVSKSVREKWSCWIAEWGNKCNYTSPYGMWQNGTAKVPNCGCLSAIDHDYSYTDYPKIIKDAGMNGYKKSTTTATIPAKTEKVLDTGSCYKLGETTVGALAVKELLRLAKVKKMHSVSVTENKTYDESAIGAVKALQKAWGYKQTGRAGANFVKMLYEKLK